MIKSLPVDTAVPCQSRPELFGAQSGETAAERGQRNREARVLCRSCPVWEPCRQLGRELGERGMWGGETDHERRQATQLRKNRQSVGPNLTGTRRRAA